MHLSPYCPLDGSKYLWFCVDFLHISQIKNISVIQAWKQYYCILFVSNNFVLWMNLKDRCCIFKYINALVVVSWTHWNWMQKLKSPSSKLHAPVSDTFHKSKTFKLSRLQATLLVHFSNATILKSASSS